MKEKISSLLTLFFCLILGGKCPAQTLALAFHKKADSGALRPLLLMPMDEKLRYIQNQKIEVIKISPQERPATESPAMDEAVRNFIGKAQNGRFVLIPEGADMKPAILLSTRADDWVVLREFMRSRMARSYGEESNPAEMLELKEIISSSSQSNKTQVSAFVRYANLRMADLLSHELEDMVIEAHLRFLYETEKPLGFDERNYDRSMSTISKTGAAVLKVLGDLSLCGRELEKHLKSEDKDLDIELESAETQIAQLNQDVLAFSEKIRVYMPH